MLKLSQITDIFWEQKGRWILWVPVFIAIGIGLYFSINFEPNHLIAEFVAFVSLYKIYRDYQDERNYLIFIPIFLIAIGFSAAQLRTERMQSQMLYNETPPIMVEGKVVNIETLPKDEHRAVLENIIYSEATQNIMPERIRIKLKKGQHYVPYVGETIRVRAVLLPLASPVLPNAFDFQRYGFFKGFYATGYSISDAEIIGKDKDNTQIFPSIRRYLREHIKEKVEDPDIASIIIALLYGEDRDISKDVTDVVRQAGIAHLLAISGLQVALVTGFFFFLVRYLMAFSPKLTLNFPIKKIAAFIAMLGSVFYMFLIGDAVSAERSVIMVCVFMTAIILDREPFTLRVTAFAATIMLLYQPDILFGASFQLSFSAVVALIAFYEATQSKWDFVYGKKAYYMHVAGSLFAVIATTFVATIAVFPFSLFHFLRASTFPGLVANMIAVPLSSFVTLPAAILASLLMPLGLENYPLQLASWSVEVILRVCVWVSDWSGGMLYANTWPVSLLIAIALGGLWLCIWRGKLRLFGLIPIVISFLIIPFVPRADILIADEGKMFAIRDISGNLWFSERDKEKFIREKWQEMEGNIAQGFWDNGSSPVRCDNQACVYKYGDKVVSFVSEQSALGEDCIKADIIISNLEINRERCKNPEIIIDGNDLLYKDAHVIYKNIFGDIIVKSSGDIRGTRPWVVY